ncbi:oxygen-independent coproporphyrinogen-III oxidase-like protein Rv2388c [Candidatus Planktophila sp.]|nr:oxygen-independent coproporphyrinogen-III oxidase-like protein Rv2388c [Candidatus Planktophila sp.]
MNLAFYIHIPYCVKRCGYCDFNTYTPSELKITEGLAQISNSYIDLLLMEMKAAKVQVGQSANVPSIFFGGGTPSLMQPDDIGRVISTIKSEFTLLPDAEITMECNPDTVTKESLAAFRAIGVNRVSFGMQSAVKHVLATLDRTHNPENLLQVTTWAKEVGFSEISVDLIYGTPGESLSDWQTSIDAALALPITHISAYALIVEEGTKLAAQIKRGEVAQVDDDLTAEKYLVADKAFTAAGFEWYELSNWAKSGSLSKHNLAYWLGDNWWGAGPGAHSHLNGKRFWNVKHPNLYKERVLANQSPVADSEVLEELQIESERLMLSLRLPSGVDKQSLNELQLAELSSYVESGHLDQANWNQGRATLTLDGRLIADRILRQILL